MALCRAYAALWLLLTCPVFVKAAPYTIEVLPFPFGTLPRAINSRDEIVGRFQVGTDGAYHAFFYHDGVFQDLGTLGGQTSEAWAVNDAGQVVGVAQRSIGGNHAFIWSANEGMRDLGPGNAYGVNEGGSVAGNSNSLDGIVHAFYWDPAGRSIDLGTLGGPSSQAFDINDVGEVVGASGTTPVNSPDQAVAWSPAATIRRLETPPGSNSFAASINNLGNIVGQIPDQAVLWTSDGELHPLGRLTGNYSSASSINNLQQVVGSWYESHPAGPERAFLWDSTNEMQDLVALVPDSSGWTNLFTAGDINDHGQIIGVGLYNGTSRAYIMTPVPEPSTWLSALIGAATAAFIAAIKMFRNGGKVLS